MSRRPQTAAAFTYTRTDAQEVIRFTRRALQVPMRWCKGGGTSRPASPPRDPIMTTPSLEQAPAAGAAPTAGTTATVLVTAADASLRTSIATALAAQDYRIFDALDGPAALER